MDTSYLAIATVQSDEILDNLPPMIEKNRQLVLPAERITVAAAIEAFQRRFPLGFEDPSYIGDRKIGERAYKVLAHEYLDAEFGNGKLRSRLSGDIGGVIDVVNKAIGMVNLLAVQESLALRDALQDQVRAEQFVLRLADLLESDEPDEAHFNAYADSIANLPALRGSASRRGPLRRSCRFLHNRSGICSSSPR